jgi:sugar phosphate isomerase/epimerase
MKLTFSTLGCPGWSWDEIFATAKDLGMNGIEIRGIENELYAPEAKPFRDEHFDNTMAALQKGNLTISMLTSGALLSDRENKGKAIAEGKAYIDLAARVGSEYIRVLGDLNPAPVGFIDLALVRSLYTELCDYAVDKNIKVLIETNGVFADSKILAKFMTEVNHPNSGVLWDVHHPCRFFGEKPEETAFRIGHLVKYMHVKDSVIENGKVSYRMLGYGDVPVLDALKQMKALNYDGFVSLEWVKRWNPNLEEPGIVFSHYISYMGYLFRQMNS